MPDEETGSLYWTQIWGDKKAKKAAEPNLFVFGIVPFERWRGAAFYDLYSHSTVHSFLCEGSLGPHVYPFKEGLCGGRCRLLEEAVLFHERSEEVLSWEESQYLEATILATPPPW